MKFVIAYLMFLVLAVPGLAASKTVRDWTGTCDEYSCTAEVTGSGGLAMGGQGYRLQIARSSDPSGAWYVKLVVRKLPAPSESSAVLVTIDDGEAIPTKFSADASGEGFDFADQASLEKLFPMLRTGNRVKIAYDDQAEEFSLSGIAAVLLWIDDQQKRVGNSDQVAAIAPEPGGVEGADADALHKRISGINVGAFCQWNNADQDPPPLPIEKHDLGQGKTLYIVGCTLGAYQPSTMIFVEDDVDGLVPIPFADYSSEAGWGAALELGFVDFDPKTKELSNFVKFRGIGDCGSSSRYRWDGYLFKMLEYRYRDCDNDPPEDPDGEIPEFPVVYEAK